MMAMAAVGGVIGFPRKSQANGRYPAAQYFALGENSASNRIAIVTTFGLVLSTDGGRTWGWVCEDAIGYTGQYDSVVGITDDGTLVATLPDGVSRSTGDWCDFERPPTSASVSAVDISVAGNRVAAAMTPVADLQFVQLSADNGTTWARGWGRNEFYAHTIDFAPSRPSRMYMTAWVRGAVPAMFRSDDMGVEFTEINRDFSGGYIAYISWVDPMNEGTVLVRTDLDPSGAILLRSDNGGTNLRPIFRSPSPLLGIAAAPGAQRIWATNTMLNDRIHRSENGGADWATVNSTLRPRSMRFVRNTLYATVAENEVGFSFACSPDGGDTFVPMLALSDIRGPERCRMGSTVRTMCSATWDTVRASLQMLAHPPSPPRGVCEGAVGDAGVEFPDAGADDSGTTTDAASLDAGDATSTNDRDAARDALDAREIAGDTLIAGGGRCSCSVVAAKGAQTWNFAVPLLLVLSTGRIPRKRLRK